MRNQYFDNPNFLRITKFSKSIEIRRIHIKNILLINKPAIFIESYLEVKKDNYLREYILLEDVK
jgi:hypothetical protein